MITFQRILELFKGLKISGTTGPKYTSVLSKEEIDHKNRLGGKVRNPKRGWLQAYNKYHPLWFKK